MWVKVPTIDARTYFVSDAAVVFAFVAFVLLVRYLDAALSLCITDLFCGSICYPALFPFCGSVLAYPVVSIHQT